MILRISRVSFAGEKANTVSVIAPKLVISLKLTASSMAVRIPVFLTVFF